MKTSNKRHTILVVDDDAAQVSLLEQILQQDENFKIITTTSGKEALRLAEMYAPHIILSDYFMPEVDGFALCRKIKEHPLLKEGMFILLTSATSVEDKVKGLESGADEFISKPVHPDELFARVRAGVRVVELQEDLKLQKQKLAEANKALQESYDGMLDLLTLLVGVHVPNATKRADRGIHIIQWFGKKLELTPEEIQLFSSATALHEIGKISLPEDVLEAENKDFGTKERSHYPIAGERLLSKIPKLADVGVIIRHQLENFDGSGYPDRLLGEEIPLGARLLRVVNYLEHLEGNVKDLTTEKIIEGFQKSRGIMIDPVFVQLIEEYLNVEENRAWMEGKKAIAVSDLIPGMILAADLKTGSGTKLLPKDSIVTQMHINKINAHHQVDPIMGSIFIVSK
jgi:putative two-component system response regulator